ncbi:MAG: O-antigen ligase family protein [Caldilineaceae bacterium]
MANLSTEFSIVPNAPAQRRALRIAGLVTALVSLAWLLSSQPLTYVSLASVVVVSAVLLLRWPWLIWPVLAFLLPYSSSLRVGPITGTEVILFTAAFLWLLGGTRRDSLQLYSYSIVILPLLYAAVLLLSLLSAVGLAEGIAEVVKWAEFALVAAMLPAMTAPKNSIWTAVALIVGAVVQSLLGLYQFWFQIGPEWFVLFGRYMRASGTFRQPNPYAGYLGVILPIAVSLAIWAWASLRGGRWRVSALAWAGFYSVAALVILAGLLASWSRGAWLAAVAAFLVVVAVRSRWGMVLALVAGTTVLLAGATALVSATRLPLQLQLRLQGVTELVSPWRLLAAPVTDENFALIERLAHWVAGYRMWASAPWLGIGAGNFELAYGQVNIPVWAEPLGHAHNLYLNVLAESGLVGFVVFVIFWTGLAIWTWRRAHAVNGCGADWSQAMAAGVLGSMTYLTIHNFVDVLFVQGIYLALALPVAVLASATTSRDLRDG